MPAPAVTAAALLEQTCPADPLKARPHSQICALAHKRQQMSQAMRQMPARAGRAGAARGEAVRELVSDEAENRRHDLIDTGNPREA